nr:uncharacterized protein LOC117275567 [Nicotiana tomentosiformis]
MMSVSPVVNPVVSPPSHEEAEPSSGRRSMKKVLIEVPDGGNLLNKSREVVVWLKPFLGPVERKKLEARSSLTLMNDIIHSSLKINLTVAELMRGISWIYQQVIELRTEADNWKE